ncbi:LOW QUALITY PROTEIN: putative U-box domain-containing protein 50 [Neltuma alba]|uniref:LOW QUALITY PROTEIN: putative U-box domain-containing protein 50 n=1 Tax=Neltuma alba TaxID=207710 RepID=UPI0010A4E869|nr:LOW QUALITY PROTEIN: putative U-box domain-containing protein 50 [Prosopis alba]
MDATAQTGKIYVAVSNDLQDGIKTLNWALNKWKSYPISIVILYVSHNTSKDHVTTPFGKLPARSVNDEMLPALRKQEQEKIDKLLSKYISFCGKVPAEILEVDKFDEPIQKRVVDMIIGLEITKLVIGFSVMKPSWKSRGAISGLFYIHQHKPEFCELFILCGGKQVFMRGQSDEKTMEDDNGVVVARMRDKITFKDWLDKLLPREPFDSPDYRGSANSSSASMESPGSQNQWEFYLQEIETYFQDLLSSHTNDEQLSLEHQDSDISRISGVEPDDVREQNNSNMRGAERIETLKRKLEEAHKMIQLKRKEAKDQSDRHAKAEWAICLCNARAQELEGKIKEEINMKEELAKELEAEKETIYETRRDIEESRKRLSSLLELQLELSNKLQISTQARSQAEIQLENAANTRSEMVAEIDELRRQRDVLYRRIEFCKEKDAIGMAARLTEPSLHFREYTVDEIRLATDDFSDRLMLKSGGADWTNVYRGKINHSTVAIKIPPSNHALSPQEFQAQVRLLGAIRHPHVLAMVGFCSELKCIVLEYMNNGSLRDMLFSRRRNRALPWQDRIRIAAEVCSGLGFLHSAQPKPFIHGHLTPSSILLDRNLVAKIKGFGSNEGNPQSDVRAFGVLIMHLLTGRNWVGLVEEEMKMGESLMKVLDETAGPWQLNVAQKLADLALKCMGFPNGPKPKEGLSIGNVMLELNEIRREANDEGARGDTTRFSGGVDKEELMDVPNVFLCPILQEVMKNPHVAADGFSYELEAIEEWVGSGHERSPMTNARLPHLFFTPNHSLRSLILDWQTKRSSHFK